MPRFANPIPAAPAKKAATPAAEPQRPGLPRQSALAQTLQLRAAASARAAGATIGAAGGSALPERLKTGIESLSGLAMDDVRIHRNSSEPAKLGAVAYAKGADIHLAPGQERHLAHEAWHVVQQKQGRVRPTVQVKGDVAVNDDPGLEREADAMGAEARSLNPLPPSTDHVEGTGGRQPLTVPSGAGAGESTVQRRLIIGGNEAEVVPADVVLAHAARIGGWIADPIREHPFANWEAADTQAGLIDAALGRLHGAGWPIPEEDIIDPELSASNCHGLTFGAAWVGIELISDFLARWVQAGSPRVLLCLAANDQVAHSATWIGGSWRQTLPDAPIFRSDRATIAQSGGYTCFDLSIAVELAAVTARSVANEQAFQASRQRLITRCLPATLIPVVNRTNAQHDHAGWHQYAVANTVYSLDTANTIIQYHEYLDADGIPP